MWHSGKKHLFSFVVALVAVLSPVLAQTDLSTIRGNVSDATGAVILGAKVVLTNVQTGLERQVVTSPIGAFEFPDLRRGTYKLQVSGPGFKSFVADNIILESNQIRRVDAT